jgi:hypothetical protein
MSTANRFLSEKIKLEKLYTLALQSPDDVGFFTHVHNYVETIRDNRNLSKLVWQIWISAYLQEHSIKEPPEGHRIPGDHRTTYLLLYMQYVAMSNYRAETRLYACWSFLNMYYEVRNTNFNNLLEGVRSLTTDTKQPLFTSKELQKINNIVPSGLNDARNEIKSIVTNNTSAQNMIFNRQKFRLYLEVFHLELMERLSTDKSTATPDAPGSIKLELDFTDIYPVVLDTSTGTQYRFARMSQNKRPYRIIKYCYSNPGISVGEAKLSETIVLSNKGLLASLQHSNFDPNEKGPLSIFLEIDRRPAKLMLHRTIHVEPWELQELAQKAVEVIPNS